MYCDRKQTKPALTVCYYNVCRRLTGTYAAGKIPSITKHNMMYIQYMHCVTQNNNALETENLRFFAEKCTSNKRTHTGLAGENIG